MVASYHPHHGEEDCLRGRRGSGTIFFAGCNLRCVFCQNFEISQEVIGCEVSAERLAMIMVELQDSGCHNVNLVTPEHVVPQILEALPIAVEEGLSLPLVYNTNAYGGPENLALLDGVVDIYMPDAKYSDDRVAGKLSLVKDYWRVARAAIKDMHRQVGDLAISPEGLAERGLLVRHLVLPDGLAGTREVARFLASEVSPDTYVNVMGQYRPDHRAWQHPQLRRPITRGELAEAVRIAREEGLSRFDERWMA
jgi:putative pyruvate formate lyase activating enzyme